MFGSLMSLRFLRRLLSLISVFFFYSSRPHRDLHSFPTRRSSDLSSHTSSTSARNCISTVTVPSPWQTSDRKSTRLNSSHLGISYAVFCLKKKKKKNKKKKNTYRKTQTNNNYKKDTKLPILQQQQH